MHAVDVWQMPTQFAVTDDQLSCLSDDQRQHYLSLKEVKARQWYLQHQVFRRQILALYLACEAHDIEFAQTTEGKPYIKNSDEIQFNLSHSHGQCLLAVAGKIAVGIDVEKLRAINNWQAIAQRVFPDHWLQGQNFQRLNADNFIHSWCEFEARQKCLGQGVFGKGSADHLHCQRFQPQAGYVAVLCTEQPVEIVRFYQLPPQRE